MVKENKITLEHKEILAAINGIDHRLTIIETKQEERHVQNQKDIDGVGALARTAEKHCHELGKLKVHRNIHWFLLSAIVIALILK